VIVLRPGRIPLDDQMEQGQQTGMPVSRQDADQDQETDLPGVRSKRVIASVPLQAPSSGGRLEKKRP
jgi:hypothetical protein